MSLARQSSLLVEVSRGSNQPVFVRRYLCPRKMQSPARHRSRPPASSLRQTTGSARRLYLSNSSATLFLVGIGRTRDEARLRQHRQPRPRRRQQILHQWHHSVQHPLLVYQIHVGHGLQIALELAQRLDSHRPPSPSTTSKICPWSSARQPCPPEFQQVFHLLPLLRIHLLQDRLGPLVRQLRQKVRRRPRIHLLHDPGDVSESSDSISDFCSFGSTSSSVSAATSSSSDVKSPPAPPGPGLRECRPGPTDACSASRSLLDLQLHPPRRVALRSYRQIPTESPAPGTCRPRSTVPPESPCSRRRTAPRSRPQLCAPGRVQPAPLDTRALAGPVAFCAISSRKTTADRRR